jgi:hypothetical protein
MLFGTNKKKKTWLKRPDEWEVVAQHYAQYGGPSTINAFNMVGHPATLYSRLERWKRDYQNGKIGPNFLEQQAIAEATFLERTLAESRLVLPFTFGELRRVLNADALAAVDGQVEPADQFLGAEKLDVEDSDDDDDSSSGSEI